MATTLLIRLRERRAAQRRRDRYLRLAYRETDINARRALLATAAQST